MARPCHGQGATSVRTIDPAQISHSWGCPPSASSPRSLCWSRIWCGYTNVSSVQLCPSCQPALGGRTRWRVQEGSGHDTYARTLACLRATQQAELHGVARSSAWRKSPAMSPPKGKAGADMNEHSATTYSRRSTQSCQVQAGGPHQCGVCTRLNVGVRIYACA